MRRVLVPTDFSPCSRRAFSFALGLGRETPLSITLIHVFDQRLVDYLIQVEGISEEGVRERMLLRARASISELFAGGPRTDTPVDMVFLQGIPDEAILAYAKDQGADWIVLGISMEHEWNLRRRSVADRLLAGAAFPVLVVKDSAPVEVA